MRYLFSSFLFLFYFVSAANNNFQETKIIILDGCDTLVNSPDTIQTQILLIPADSLKNKILKKKFISAVFAFPFPFGFMGAHRIMLGTKPWVPIIYAATFGGCFGILPLIDFCVIVFSKDIEQYENNPKVFMWIK